VALINSISQILARLDVLGAALDRKIAYIANAMSTLSELAKSVNEAVARYMYWVEQQEE